MARRPIIALLVAAIGANGQFLSYMKTSSWVQDSDGVMHEKTVEHRNEISGDDGITKRVHTDVICVDGDCSKRRSVNLQMPCGSMRMVQTQRGIGGLRGFVQERKMPVFVVMDDAQGQPVTVQKRIVHQAEEPPLGSNERLLATALAGSSLMCAAIAMIRVFCCSGTASARELPDLAQPLNATQLAAPILAPARVEEKAKEEEKVEEPQAAPGFQFKPSVGTWLVHVEA